MGRHSRAEMNSADLRVQAALQDYFGRIDRGERIDVDAFLAQHSDVCDEVRSFIEFDEQTRWMAGGVSPSNGSLPADAHLQPPFPNAAVSTHSVVEQTVGTVAEKRKLAAASLAAKSPDDLPEIFGRYRVKQKLGEGAMGAVYLAEDTLLQRKVALKTPKFEGDVDGELLRRFYREAKAAAGLKHPNLCAIYDIGEIGGRHYISMEFVPGKKLQDLIKLDQPMTEKQAIAIVRKIALGMHEAHIHGVIHRDLKPDNIMVNATGEPVVMDFGLVHKTSSEHSTKITQHGSLVGSPAYMSKEQVEGDPNKLTGATDQYSLGVTLYQLLTSKLPFEGGIHSVLGAILTKEPPPPSEHHAGINPRLEAVCLKMMAKEAKDRYPSMKAAAEALSQVARGVPSELGETTATRSVVDTPNMVSTSAEHAPATIESHPFNFESRGNPPIRRQAAPQRRSPEPRKRVLYASLVAALSLFLAVTVWFRSGNTLIKVEVLSDDIEVHFENDTITLKDGLKELKATPGAHTLHITANGIQFDTDKFTLKRGANQIVTVELIKSEIVARIGERELVRYAVKPVENRLPVLQQGNWWIEDGELVTEGITKQEQRLVFGDSNWKDYDLKVETVQDRYSDASMSYGIEFLNTDGTDGRRHWSLDFGSFAPKHLDMRAMVPGEDQWKTESRRWMGDQLHGEIGKWQSVEIRVRHDQVTVIVDGKTMAVSSHPKLTQGRIGVHTVHTGRCRWRNLEVRSLDGIVLWTGFPELANAHRPVSQPVSSSKNGTLPATIIDAP